MKNKNKTKTQNKKNKKAFISAITRDYRLYIMLILPMAYYILFHYVPMYGVTIAFKDYNIFDGIFASPWSGLDNFKIIFDMEAFKLAFRNTFLLNAIGLVVGFPLPIILALMLNEIRGTFVKKSFQTISYLPHFLSWVIVGGIVYQLFAPSSGYINYILTSLGFERIPFLTENGWWMFTYFLAGIWQSVGWGSIIYLAAMAGVDPSLYEAGTIDGCNKLKLTWHITLPAIRPTIVILLILNLGRFASIGFDQPFNLGNSVVSEVSEVISTFVYRVGYQNSQYSIATAVGMFMSIINIVFLLSANKLAKLFGEDGIW